jgi:hypothetical protein
MGLVYINVQASRTEGGRHLGIGKLGPDKKLGASLHYPTFAGFRTVLGDDRASNGSGS